MLFQLFKSPLQLKLKQACRFYTVARPQTIYALSSAPGKAGVAVIRISGRNALEAVEKMTLIKSGLMDARKAYFRRIRHPHTGQVLDRGLVLWFPGPHSFTGEDSVEFQIHGGNAVVKSVLNALRAIPDFRMAEQGEFSRRAFDNDKLDLTELEGLADLLNAETEIQHRLALQQAEGGLRKRYDEWRHKIIECMARTEAVIDFGEDEHIEEGVMEEVIKDVKQLYTSISTHLNDSHVGEMIRSGIQVAIVGPPNAGKSTLLNRLAKREAAIVSSIPGTTRDVVEVKLDLGGYPVIVCDTAGLRESNDIIEIEGIKRAKARILLSDLKICLLPLNDIATIDPIVRDIIDKDTYLILNKEDTVSSYSKEDIDKLISMIKKEIGIKHIWTMSCTTGKGVDLFLNQLINIIKDKFDSSIANPALITQARHREHLEDCIQYLESFLNMSNEEIVLSAEELRQAANALGRITGKIDVENVLDALFGQFCIGK
ncbi:tRNA modification GTPase TrmE [Cokeromyces recurvatus]|uniref:tRNA modification GTPase TrmE n=1 Tax=Cokeromyces recurvatus TaxID=90255 RepID=UPI00221F4664|nr:tRNA modification GTPase TrmE [Cokeromyces recurvatus]KAI7898725.1 tRNA modification GTPase TrmE [Cokeromyces recurvatus]